MADPGVAPPIVLEAGMVKVPGDIVPDDSDLAVVEGVDMQPGCRRAVDRDEAVIAANSLDNRWAEDMRDD